MRKKRENYADNSKPQIQMVSQVKILENKILRKKIEKVDRNTMNCVHDNKVTLLYESIIIRIIIIYYNLRNLRN